METKFEVEKEWEVIARKREEAMSMVLEKAKEFEEMEMILATRFRNKLKTCIRGVPSEKNPNDFDKPTEIMEAEKEKVRIFYEPIDYKWDAIQTRSCLRWRSRLTSSGPSTFQEFSKYVFLSLDPQPPPEFNFTDVEKIQSAKVALDHFNSKHPDNPYTFVEMVAALRIVDMGLIFHVNFTARPSDGGGDSSCPRLFFASGSPRHVQYCCILDSEKDYPEFEDGCCRSLAPGNSPYYSDEEGDFSVKRPRSSVHPTTTAKRCRHLRPRLFISGGIVHPTDVKIRILAVTPPWSWRCFGCSPYNIEDTSAAP